MCVVEPLLQPHRCYWPAIPKALQTRLHLDGIANITGGGLYDNVPRILPDDVMVRFEAANIHDAPPIFKLLQKCGKIDNEEMYRVFNMGVGMAVVLPPSAVGAAQAVLDARGVPSWVLGETRSDAGAAASVTLTGDHFAQ